jgi:Protein phosphatase 2C
MSGSGSMHGERPGVTMMETLDPDLPAGDGRTSRWQAVTATERGAAHRAAGLPNQDAVEVRPFGGGMVAAVADGHGHSRHFRSARGARLAVSIACEAAGELAGRPDGPPADPEELRRLLVPEIVTQWRDAVHRDVAAEPFTGAEEAVRRGDDATIPYGSTLLVAIGTGERLLLAQIGDGDIVCIRPDGTALLAVPGDPLLDGRHTTSLCSHGAGDSFRVATVDLAGTAVLGALLATDGYGNAQVAQVWESVVSAELAGPIATRPLSWMASQLQAQAGQCASVDGSADDTTLALLLAPAAAQDGPAAQVPPAGG